MGNCSTMGAHPCFMGIHIRLPPGIFLKLVQLFRLLPATGSNYGYLNVSQSSLQVFSSMKISNLHHINIQSYAKCTRYVMLHTDISEENLYKDRACVVVLCFVPAGTFCPHQSCSGYLTIYGTTQTICVRVRKSHESAKTACMYMPMSFLVMIYCDCPRANRTTLTNTTKHVT